MAWFVRSELIPLILVATTNSSTTNMEGGSGRCPQQDALDLRTCTNLLAQVGDVVCAGDVVAEGQGISGGESAIGKNLVVAWPREARVATVGCVGCAMVGCDPGAPLRCRNRRQRFQALTHIPNFWSSLIITRLTGHHS